MAAERHHEAQKHPRRRGGRAVHSRALYDALHVGCLSRCPQLQMLSRYQAYIYLKSMPLPCRTIYNMCTQKPPNDYSEQLYTRYRQSFSVYITERVRDFSTV